MPQPTRPKFAASSAFAKGGAILASIIVIIGAGVYAIQQSHKPLPLLTKDANTVYLATAPKNTSFTDFMAKWHWQPTTNYLYLAPYTPHPGDLEVDVQMKNTENSLQSDDFFGIIVGVTDQQQGYLCGPPFGDFPIVNYPTADRSTISAETTSGTGQGFADYRTLTVKIRGNTITLFEDGQQFAQATTTAYNPRGRVGLMIEAPLDIQSFRIEQPSNS